MADKTVWTYTGPLLQFGRIICDRWSSQTTAETKAKAIANLTYQAKKALNLVSWAKLELDTKLITSERG